MMEDKYGLVEKGFIPLDKGWIIRMGILDLINGYDDILVFLERQGNLCEDLIYLNKSFREWRNKDIIDVGESGTLFRYLQFISWKHNFGKRFIKRNTLIKRKICDNSEIINWDQKDLLKLDNNTSQWASAAVLNGDSDRIENPPYKLKLTYESIAHWKIQRRQEKRWVERYDETILKQAESFLDLLNNELSDWKPEQAEDYCFARMIGKISKEEGLDKWPSLLGHESNMIEEMEKEFNSFERNRPIGSRDHRVIQALAMYGLLKGKSVKFIYPSSVNKSWPEFWHFMDFAGKFKQKK